MLILKVCWEDEIKTLEGNLPGMVVCKNQLYLKPPIPDALNSLRAPVNLRH